MKVEQFDFNNKKLEQKLELNDSVWAVPLKKDLVAQMVYVFQSNKRLGLAHAKTRGDVSGGGKKPWKQKGTGRARSGSTRSPLWTKGGVTFVPNNRNWTKRINTKMKVLATKMVLSMKLADGSLRFVTVNDDAKLADYRALVAEKGRKLLISDNKQVFFAVRNVNEAEVVSPETMSAYDLLKAKDVVVDSAVVAKLEARLTNGK